MREIGSSGHCTAWVQTREVHSYPWGRALTRASDAEIGTQKNRQGQTGGALCVGISTSESIGRVFDTAGFTLRTTPLEGLQFKTYMWVGYDCDCRRCWTCWQYAKTITHSRKLCTVRYCWISRCCFFPSDFPGHRTHSETPVLVQNESARQASQEM